MKKLNKTLLIIILAILLIMPTIVKAEEQETTKEEVQEEQLNEEETQEEKIITNDINNDGELNQEDVTVLEDNILKEDYVEEEKEVLDINKDENVDIKDLVSLDNIVKGELENGTTTKADFKIKTKLNKNIISYKVYMKTDGTVRSFIFDINKTKNIKLLEMKVEENIKFNDEQTLRIIGLGYFNNNDLLATIYYELLGYKPEKITLNKGMIVYDNGKFNDNIKHKNIFKRQKQTKKLYYNQPNYNVNFLTKKEVKKEQNTKKNNNSKKQIVEKNNTTKKSKKEQKQVKKAKEISTKNIFKVILIVLLGALTIYLLNNENEENEEKK